MKKNINATFSTIKIYFTPFSIDPFNVASLLLEKLERIATDSFFQSVRLKLIEWCFNRTPESLSNCPKLHSICNSLTRSDNALTYGRPISAEGKSTYSFLHNRGISTRDLRIAVFSNFINDDGSISFKPFKLRIGQAFSWYLLTITAIALIDFAIWLMHNPADWLTSLTAFGIFTTVLVVLEYPLMVLGLRPVQVSKRIKKIAPAYLLS
ncbi:MAG: hypothetical protein COC19_06660 [SAR86 cluster bacterium]|uniref:Uncharacterized protein n=1 Tax=SAR86 cluster bacterium TaxID=2030880 RepID=A0A2A4MJA5_9GAMM|nr:MAG: hypothetical protein COC19_06660 [SAR86 cluster bacterium]